MVAPAAQAARAPRGGAALGARASVRHAVPHVRQAFNWDCGLACVCMVLRAIGRRDAELYALRQMCPTTSIWTVDLAFLLRRHGVPVSFLTVTLGANPDFENESFYRENMAEDCTRVDALFARAAAEGITVEKRSLGEGELLQHMLGGRHVFIVLVDKRKLSWYRTRPARAGGGAAEGGGAVGGGGAGGGDGCVRAVASASSSNRGTSGYTGHYVVVIGYENGEYIVRDPASTAPESVRVTPAVLEQARKCFGTDEDLLLVDVGAPRDKA